MKHSKTTIILSIFISMAFFALGLFTFDKLRELILPKVDGGFYQVLEINTGFKMSLLFSLVLGLTPIAIYLLWQYSPIVSKQKRLSSILLIILCLVLAMIARHQMIKSYFARVVSNSSSSIEKVNVNFTMEDVHLEYYLFLGLCLGCIISFWTLRQKRG